MLFFQLHMFAITVTYCACWAEEKFKNWYHSQLYFCLYHLSLTWDFISTNLANWWGCYWVLLNHHTAMLVIPSALLKDDASLSSLRCTSAFDVLLDPTIPAASLSLCHDNQVREVAALIPPPEHVLPEHWKEKHLK